LYAVEMMIAKYFGRRNGAALLDACEPLLEPLRGRAQVRELVDLLRQAGGDVIEGPRAIAEVPAQRVPEVVVPHDMTQRVHPALEAAVHGLAEAGDVVRADLAGRRVALLAVRAVQDDVEVDEVEAAERPVRALRAERLEVSVEPDHLRLEDHDAAGREVIGHDDVRVRAFTVATLRWNDVGQLVERGLETCERIRVLFVVVGDINRSAVHELGPCTTKLDRVNCER
jgi:hypothetical protein